MPRLMPRPRVPEPPASASTSPADPAMKPVAIPETLSKMRDSILVIVLLFLAQLLIAGIEETFDKLQCSFPPAILAMTFVFATFSLLAHFWPRLDELYIKYLRSPADLLNRHMSIGFTIPLLMICRNPLTDPKTIGMIIICFFVTGFLNTIVTYLVTWRFQIALTWCITASRRLRAPDVEQAGSSSISSPTRVGSAEERNKNISETSSMVSNQGYVSTSSGEQHLLPVSNPESSPVTSVVVVPVPSATAAASLRSRAVAWARLHPVLILFWVMTLSVGIPLRLHTDIAVAFDTFLLFSLWLTSLAIQAAFKTSRRLRPWARILLSGVFNAVLWTSLAMAAYAFAESARCGVSVHQVLDGLQKNVNFSTFLLQNISASQSSVATLASHSDSILKDSICTVTTDNSSSIATSISSPPLATAPAMAAGDVATSILNAGLVSWGFKLYEHRHELLSGAGLTVFLVSSVVALGNVLFGPLLTHAVGLGPASRDVAFAARSVTIALGSPAIAQMGGDLSLNAALVVFSGIVYQMGLGFGLGNWLDKMWTRLECRYRGVVNTTTPASEPDQTSATTTQDLPSPNRLDTPGALSTEMNVLVTDATATANAQPSQSRANTAQPRRRVNDPRTVAAGTTIGINSAAMGTAHLYEAKSEAAPFSALSMTILGIMTVAFTSIHPIARWVLDRLEAGGE